MNIRKIFAVLFTVFVTGPLAIADSFNMTNYPVVAQIKQAFSEFQFSNPNDGVGRSAEFWKTIDANTKAQYVEQLAQIAEENNGAFPQHNPMVDILTGFDSVTISNLDVRLAATGTQVWPTWQWNGWYNSAYSFPRCFDNYWNSLTEEQKNSIAVLPYHQYKSTGEWPTAVWINHYVYAAASVNNLVDSHFTKKLVISRLTSAIRHILREQGKTFFTDKKTGKNPVQDAIDEFIAAANQPKWGGVQAFVAKWWPEYEWVPVTNWKSDEEIENLKTNVYYGDIEFNDKIKAILINYLGLDAYNEFIEYYNGDSSED